MNRKIRLQLQSLGIIFLSILLVLGLQSPARASTVVKSPTVQWFPEISKYSSDVNRGFLVKAWQSILWARFAGTSSSYGMSRDCNAFADSSFGNNTHYWTTRWQSEKGLGADGQVGPQTWGNLESNYLGSHSSYDTRKYTWVDGERVWFSVRAYWYVSQSGRGVLFFKLFSFSNGWTPRWRFNNCQPILWNSEGANAWKFQDDYSQSWQLTYEY